MHKLPLKSSSLGILIVLLFLSINGRLMASGPLKVEIIGDIQGAQLMVDGEPFYVKGAGTDRNLEMLAQSGANTIRTWGSEGTAALLDEAHAHGLKVAAGLWVEHERHGYDYNDPVVVEQQLKKHKAAIDQFKDHPALLIWFVGNEIEHYYTNPKVWDLVEQIAAYAKKVDPNHPVGTVTMHPNKDVIKEILARCPSLDVYGINTYAGISVVPRDLREAGWEKPFMITEWGPNGHWEVPSTEWDAPIEQTSREKAKMFQKRYEFILDQPGCIGNFLFFWGQKQEVTSTWYGLFTKEGRHTEVVDRMTQLWSGEYPSIRCPSVSPIKLNGKKASSDVKLPAKKEHFEASFELIAGSSEDLEVHWMLYRESSDRKSGGDAEKEPEEVSLHCVSKSFNSATFKVPESPGAYRLFLEVRGNGNTAATANFPFYVTD